MSNTQRKLRSEFDLFAILFYSASDMFFKNSFQAKLIAPLTAPLGRQDKSVEPLWPADLEKWKTRINSDIQESGTIDMQLENTTGTGLTEITLPAPRDANNRNRLVLFITPESVVQLRDALTAIILANGKES
jgi:hypothetical protein